MPDWQSVTTAKLATIAAVVAIVGLAAASNVSTPAQGETRSETSPESKRTQDTGKEACRLASVVAANRYETIGASALTRNSVKTDIQYAYFRAGIDAGVRVLGRENRILQVYSPVLMWRNLHVFNPRKVANLARVQGIEKVVFINDESVVLECPLFDADSVEQSMACAAIGVAPVDRNTRRTVDLAQRRAFPFGLRRMQILDDDSNVDVDDTAATILVVTIRSRSREVLRNKDVSGLAATARDIGYSTLAITNDEDFRIDCPLFR